MIEFNEAANSLHIAGELTIYQVAEAKAAIEQILASDELLTIDLTDVTEIDCAGLQLLIAVARQTPGTPQLIGNSRVQEIIGFLNLGAHFNTDNLANRSSPL